MKLMTAPNIGPRPVDEFVYGGPLRRAPDVATCSDSEWTEHVFLRDGAAARRSEWWYHRPTGSWVVVERDSLTDAASATSVPAREADG